MSSPALYLLPVNQVKDSVNCPNCAHQNSAEAKFCTECGTSLTITCPVCSTVAGLNAKFCSNCGTDLHTSDASPADAISSKEDLARYLPPELQAKLHSARSGHAMQGERRTVTMLFADIKGSTAAAEQLDPEDWAVIVNGAFEHLIAPVYRYEGTLAHLQGDAVLAFFGAPIAHEDDPVRAVRSGLEIVEAMEGYSETVQDKWGLPIEVRVGINTGLVVVGEVGSDLRVEYTALGDAINVAARMEQTAEPGTVRITGETLALTGESFEVEDLGSVEVKGKSAPVPASRVIGFVGGIGEESDQPIVGRDDEIGLLDDLRARLIGGSGWIASVIAEAGVGKSRLLHELRSRSEAEATLAMRFDQPGNLSWLFGLSRSYDSSNPFSTIGNLLTRWWGIDDANPNFSEVERAVAEAGIENPDVAAYLGFIAGIPLSESANAFISALAAPALHGGAGEALSSYLTALAGQRPVLIVLEDLHWADDLSLGLVDKMMDLSEQFPVGLVVAMRPYREESTWHIHEVAERDHHHRYHYINLAPLARAESTELLDSLLEDSGLSEETRQSILERSDGNPLFLEEIVRSVHETEPGRADEVSVPTSLSGILTARLDRLEDESRYVVQMASVLGSEFDRDMLAALLEETYEDRMTDLMRQGIFVEFGKPGSVRFRHALIQDAAYATVLRRTRKDLHRRVADHLIDARPDAVQDIARHLVEADDLNMAFPYLIDAGLQAIRSMALADAIRLLANALENTPDDADPDLVEQAHDGLGEAYGLVPDLSQAAASYQRLYEFGEQAARPTTRVAALNRLALTTASLGADLDGARVYLEDARNLAEECGDEVGLAEYHMNACFVESLGGQIGTAVEHDEATVMLGERTGVGEIRMSGMVRRAMNYIALLDLERGEPAVEAALEATEEAGMEEGAATVKGFGQCQLLLGKADFQGFLEVAEEAQSTLDRYSSLYAAMNQRNIAAVMYRLGDLEDALGRFVESRRIAEKLGQVFLIGAATSGMALIYATAGLVEPIQGLRAETIAGLEGPLGEFLASSAWADLGFVNLLLDDPEQAEADFIQGRAASSLTQFTERPRLLGGLALALTLKGDHGGAESALEEAVEFAREKSYAPYNALLRYVEGEIQIQRDQLAEGEVSLTAAQTMSMETGERLTTLRILHARARLAMQTENPDQASAHARAANTLVDSIAESIADDELRGSFESKWLGAVDQIKTT